MLESFWNFLQSSKMKKLPRLNQKTKVWSNHVLTKEILKILIGHIKYWTKDLDFEIKSLYRSCAGSNFYGTEIEIWAGFGPVESTYWIMGWLSATFAGQFFHVFMGKKMCNFFHDIVASVLKSCITSLFWGLFFIFGGQKIG